MIDIAEKIIQQLEGAFDPEEFNDRYEDALRDLIDQKRKGHKITRSRETPKDSNVVDLMDALKKSLGAKGGKTVTARKPSTKKRSARG